MNRTLNTLLLVSCLLAGCSEPAKEAEQVVEVQKYDPELEIGKKLYADRCASCHGASAAGSPGWPEESLSGQTAAPALNQDSDITWQPELKLHYVIRYDEAHASANGEGVAKELQEEELAAILAWIQSLWDEETYEQWNAMNQRYLQATKAPAKIENISTEDH